MARTFATGFLHFGNPFEEEGQLYSMGIWARPTGTNSGYLIGKHDGTNGTYLRRDGTDTTRWTASHNAVVGPVSTGGSVSNSVWQHMLVTYDPTAAAGTMVLYKNAVQLWVDTATPNIGANSSNLGVGNRADLARDYTGDLAEFAFWLGYLLLPDQRALLAAGYSPLFIRPLPTIYRALIRDESGAQAIGPASTETGGAPTVGVHPRIIYPASSTPRFSPRRAAVGAISAGVGALTLTGFASERIEDFRLTPITA